MSSTKSAIKRVRATETAEERDISKKNAVRTAVKRTKTAISTDAENRDELLRFVIKRADKASQSNLTHSNKVGHIKSKPMSVNK